MVELTIILEPRPWLRHEVDAVQTQERPGSGMQMFADPRRARIRRAGGKGQSDREGNTR